MSRHTQDLDDLFDDYPNDTVGLTTQNIMGDDIGGGDGKEASMTLQEQRRYYANQYFDSH